jgi:iron(III) transport system substrate-binding protein
MEDGWGYVEKLLVNMDGILLDSSKDVYNGVVSGEFFVGLTFEDAAAKFVRNGAPVSIVYPKEGTIIRPDGVSVIKGTKHKEYAQQFIEFVTSYETQVFIVNELNGRSIRNDVEPVSGLQSLATIYTVEDDQQWSSDNKVVILDRFTSLFKELYEK